MVQGKTIGDVVGYSLFTGAAKAVYDCTQLGAMKGSAYSSFRYTDFFDHMTSTDTAKMALLAGVTYSGYKLMKHLFNKRG